MIFRVSIRYMSAIFYKLKIELQLLTIFFGVAMAMFAYETLKEWITEGSLSLWHSHLITVCVTASFATIAAYYMRKWAVAVDEQLRVDAVAFESQDGMLITDARKSILRVNSAFTKITGYSAQEAVGQTPKILSSGVHDSHFYRAMWNTIHEQGSWQGEIVNRRKDGEIYTEQLSITAVRNREGIITHYVGALNDISQRKMVEKQVRDLAFYDTLTKLPNRRLLYDRLNHALAEFRRSGGYGAVIFLDLDKFKSLNDTQGHDVGDLLLIEVAKRLSHSVREVDTVARMGGDEFVVVLSSLAKERHESEMQAALIAEKIRHSLANPYHLAIASETNARISYEHHTSSSLGLSLFFEHADSADAVLKRADSAMYKAKGRGGNQVCYITY